LESEKRWVGNVELAETERQRAEIG